MIKRKEKKTIVHMRVQYIYFSNFFKRKNFFEFEISRRKKKKKKSYPCKRKEIEKSVT